MKSPESFVPLTAAPVPPGPREFRVSILDGHNHGQAQGGNGTGNGNAAGSAQAGPTAADGNGGARPAAFHALQTQVQSSSANLHASDKRIGEPRVTLQRDGDRVTHLRIQCPCGQIMDLACVYDAGQPTQA